MYRLIWSLIFCCFLSSSLQSQIQGNQKKLLSGEFLKFIEKGEAVEIQVDIQQPDDEKLQLLLIIAEDDLRKGLYKESVKYVFQAEKLAEISNFESLKAYTHIITASFYRHLELRNKAKESLDKAVRPMSLIKDEDEKAYVEGRFQLEKGLLDLLISKGNEGISSLWKSKDKFHSIENESLREFSIQLINNELAYFYLENLDKIDSSYFYFEQNLKTTKDLPLRLLAQNGIFRYHLQKNQPEKALNNIFGSHFRFAENKIIPFKKRFLQNTGADLLQRK